MNNATYDEINFLIDLRRYIEQCQTINVPREDIIAEVEKRITEYFAKKGLKIHD